jgi:hypothetical protein
MTETTIDSAPVRRLDLSLVAAVFLHPRRAFERIAAATRPLWGPPLLLLSLTSFLVVLASGFLKARAASMGAASLPLDFQYWTPAMQENYFQAQQAMQGPAFLYVIPLAGALISLWLGWLFLGGLLHLTSTVLGGRGSMGGALNVVAWAALPFAGRDVLRMLFMVITRQAISSPGLSGFSAGAGFWSQLLAHADLFLIWQIILLVLGLALADDLPRRKAVAGVVIVVTLLLLAQAGLGALGAGLGGLAVQRPFF